MIAQASSSPLWLHLIDSLPGIAYRAVHYIAEDTVVAVQDSSGDTLRPLTSHVASHAYTNMSSPPHLGFQPVSYGGRRLQDNAVAVPTAGLAVPTAGPPDEVQASVSALGRQDKDSALCSSFSWELVLEPGQNGFRITAMPNGQPVSCLHASDACKSTGVRLV